MDASDAVNLVALGIAFVAVLSSSVLAWRALRLNENANHLPVVMDLLKPQRRPDFTARELTLWAELSKHDPSLGFTRLPEPIRGYAYEVGLFYQSLSYVAVYGIADRDFLAVQTEWRLIRTWECIEAHVRGERVFRGSDDSFMNAYERFVEHVRSADLEAATRRLYARGLVSRANR